MNATEADFETYAPHLRGLAYRLTGSLSETDDILQEARVKWAAVASPAVDNPRAYLSKMVTRLCLDWLKSARVRRETYVGPWLPEPVLNEAELQVETINEYATDISVALLLALERLTPLERAAFLLHDVFDFDYAEVADTLQREEPAVRQLATRARAHLKRERPRHRPSAEESQRVMLAFAAAVQTGDTAALCSVLTEDAVFYSDGGGRVRAALLPIYGADKVSRFIIGLARKRAHLTDLSATPCQVNGQPALILRQGGRPEQTLAFELCAGRIRAIYAVRNPDKLQHVS